MDLEWLFDIIDKIEWNSAVSGIFGALVGGTMALLGVRQSNRHDRRMRQEEAVERSLVELDRAARNLLLIFVQRDMRIDRWTDETSSAHFELSNALVDAIARSKRREPRLHAILTGLHQHVRPEQLKAGDGRGLGAIMKLTMQWLSNPRPIRRRWRRITAEILIHESELGPGDATETSRSG